MDSFRLFEDPKPKRKRKRGKKKPHVPLGKRKVRETHLFVRCPVCGTPDAKGPLDDGGNCVCEKGFVETGFTQERYDRLIKENEKLLLMLDELDRGVIADPVAFRKFMTSKAEDLVAARSRTKCD